MRPDRRVVLVTRPEPGLGETLRDVASLGFDPVACPLLRVRGRSLRLPACRRLQAILVTSGQAVAPLAEAADADPSLRRLPLFAVGDASAARARAAGFTDTTSAGGNAMDLAALVQARRPAGDGLLLATGERQGLALAVRLRQAGYRLHRRVAYAAEPVRRLPEAGQEALQAGDVAACLFFSAGTARNFGRLCPFALHPRLGAVRALAISPAVAGALAGLPWKSVESAEHPDAAALLSLLGRPASPQPLGFP